MYVYVKIYSNIYIVIYSNMYVICMYMQIIYSNISSKMQKRTSINGNLLIYYSNL